MKGDAKVVKMSSLGSIVRKRLSDITNSVPQPQQKSPVKVKNLHLIDSSTEEYIDGLLKENKALMQLLGDKNKLIELSGIELRKLRTTLQKMQLQNWSLAQSNSRMLAELNLGRDKLKSLQHELVCKDALLKAKNAELEKNHKLNGQSNVSQHGDEEWMKLKSTRDSNSCVGGRRRPLRSLSMGPLTSQQVAENEMAENKRRCLRRQSSRVKSSEQEPKENLFELEDINYSVKQLAESPLHKETETSESKPSIKKEQNYENYVRKYDPLELRRYSIGRPARKAAVKVQSYKEVPLNIKMRRSE
ncbi:shugoshin-1 [Heracleum sosnowskyi]|uniref:Shugoshin-1 n=1 Tax=Heracleum sosnowskyi TaxID=360622 RepID=A0AAD8MY39_9APIA|nr:shugoshin-1 [Heracleum sosnowskyi]